MNINPFINLISMVLSLYGWVVLFYIIFQWLLHFQIINAYSPAVKKIHEVLWRLCEPVLKKIRRLLPHLGGIDISPIILILLIYFVKDVLYTYFYTYR